VYRSEHTFADDTGNFFLNTGCRRYGKCTRGRDADERLRLLPNAYEGTDDRFKIKMTNSLV